MNATYRASLLCTKQAILSELRAPFEPGAVDHAQAIHEEFERQNRDFLDSMKLRLIDAALDRIAAGDYGTCLNCDEPLPESRLEATPWAKYCVPCQEVVGSMSGKIPRARLDLALAE